MDYAIIASTLLAEMHGLRKMKGRFNVFDHLQGELVILSIIASQEKETKPSYISKEMNVSSARVATALNNLEDKGWIVRRINKDDRRQILVEITKEGKSFIEKQWRLVLNQITEMLKLLGEHDAQELLRIIKKIGEIINRYDFTIDQHIIN